jgi:predicted O-linked N-acetylglucosamine transferase (SPINDLY family)
MGILDCVAADERSYVEIAVELGTDPVRRAAIRKSIADRSHLLFDDARTVRELEAFFSNALARARSEGSRDNRRDDVPKET